MRALAIPIAAVGAALLTLVLWPPRHRAPNPGVATVVRVVDGDTIVARLGTHTETIRLIGIDTPESVAPHRAVECYGHEASTRLTSLLPPGTPLRLTRDVEARDRYHRLLAYVERAQDGLFVNLDQVDAGYAASFPFPPNVAHRTQFEDAERRARVAGLGLWAACGGNHVAMAPDAPP
ncbi:MAG TPA: thermonuclease family protein [Acidimicrobiales bacterium]